MAIAATPDPFVQVPALGPERPALRAFRDDVLFAFFAWAASRSSFSISR